MNNDFKRRDEILAPFFDDQEYHGGIKPFKNMPLDVIKTLKDEDFIDLDEAQNNAPSVGEFITFIENNDKFLVHGYAVSFDRGDYRISFEGLSCCDEEYLTNLPTSTLDNFIDFSSSADDFCAQLPSELYCWWD